MSQLLFSILDSYIKKGELTHAQALEIMGAARMLDPLVPAEEIERIIPICHGEYAFAVERMENMLEEIKPLHQAHWKETEAHRHGIAFNPDY